MRLLTQSGQAAIKPLPNRLAHDNHEPGWTLVKQTPVTRSGSASGRLGGSGMVKVAGMRTGGVFSGLAGRRTGF